MSSWLRFIRLLRRYPVAAERVVGMNRRNVEFVYAHNPRRYYPLVDDKITCKARLMAQGVPVPETLDICDGLFDIERVAARAERLDNYVAKPSNGSGGKGVLIVGSRCEPPEHVAGLSPTTAWWVSAGGSCGSAQLRTHLANIAFGAFSHKLSDRALLERKLEVHDAFKDLWADGVCDLRVVVQQGVPLLAMLRVPTSLSDGKANLHQGGIGVAVDIQSGVTLRAFARGRELCRHPDNGASLVGRQLPDWTCTLEVAVAAASAVPLGYLGVDIVIDRRRGPVVLEMNARPGLEIQNVNAVSLADAVRSSA